MEANFSFVKNMHFFGLKLTKMVALGTIIFPCQLCISWPAITCVWEGNWKLKYVTVWSLIDWRLCHLAALDAASLQSLTSYPLNFPFVSFFMVCRWASRDFDWNPTVQRCWFTMETCTGSVHPIIRSVYWGAKVIATWWGSKSTNEDDFFDR